MTTYKYMRGLGGSENVICRCGKVMRKESDKVIMITQKSCDELTKVCIFDVMMVCEEKSV